MSPQKLIQLFALCLISAAAHSSDVAQGTILAYDRTAHRLVFTDKTTWSVENIETPVPDDLKAGDRVEIVYESNEDDGVNAIHSIERLP